MTPRKLKQRQQPKHIPTPLVQASEYESDIPNYDLGYVPPPVRSNPEMNLSVLQRYNPAVREILCQAANAVVYIFTPDTGVWDKSGVEGTMFVCEQEPTYKSGEESYCLFVLNRRGLENLILDLGKTQDVEVTPELLIMRFGGGSAEKVQKVMGIWIHNNKDDRERNSDVIQQCWNQARASKAQRDKEVDSMSYGVAEAQAASFDPQPEALGRRISLRDLFQQNSVY